MMDKRKSINGLVSVFLMCATIMVLSGCVDKREFSQMSEEELYEVGSKAYSETGYKKAVTYFNALERLYPYSPLADQAMLLSADSEYYAQMYAEALIDYTRYTKMNPTSKNTVYAYYMRGMTYYNQVKDIYRDQSITRRGIDAFEEVIHRYPLSIFARKARVKIDLLFDRLAGKEVSIGRYYQNQNQCMPALNRYKTVIEKYSSSLYVPEALYRLTECQVYLGLKDEAVKTAKVLGYNYNDSDWYKDAYKLVKDYDTLPPMKAQGWF